MPVILAGCAVGADRTSTPAHANPRATHSTRRTGMAAAAPRACAPRRGAGGFRARPARRAVSLWWRHARWFRLQRTRVLCASAVRSHGAAHLARPGGAGRSSEAAQTAARRSRVLQDRQPPRESRRHLHWRAAFRARARARANPSPSIRSMTSSTRQRSFPRAVSGNDRRSSCTRSGDAASSGAYVVFLSRAMNISVCVLRQRAQFAR